MKNSNPTMVVTQAADDLSTEQPQQHFSSAEQVEQATSKIEPSAENSEKRETTDNSVEIGGRNGLEPTRFGDWEKNGRCIDF